MAKLNFKGAFELKTVKDTKKLECSLDLYSFIDDGIYYIYAPALDINGYGKTEKAAKESFQITLGEFFRYAINKGTIDKLLKSLGWKISKKNWISPAIENLLKDNEDFSDILHNKDYKKTTEKVLVPQLV